MEPQGSRLVEDSKFLEMEYNKDGDELLADCDEFEDAPRPYKSAS